MELIFQGLDRVDFSGLDSFSGFVFQGTIGLFGYWTGFLGNGCDDLLKDWTYWFFQGLEFFSRMED